MSPGADLGGEAGEVLVARKFPEAVGDELAGGSGVPALAGQACLQERSVGAAQGTVAGEPAETVLGFRAGQPLQQQAMPFREVPGPFPLLVAVVARSPGAVARINFFLTPAGPVLNEVDDPSFTSQARLAR